MLPKSIGIFGGTFDPIHLGHLHLAREVLKKTDLDTILFIPCYRSAYKKPIFATPSQRVAMLRLAIKGEEKFCLDTREIQRKDISYTIDTLLSLQTDYPKTKFYLILGADSFALFSTWHKWQDILKLANLIVVDRPDTSLESELISARMLGKKNKIKFVQINALSIAATEIRDLIKLGKSIEHLVPKSVCKYIKKNGLYLK